MKVVPVLVSFWLVPALPALADPFGNALALSCGKDAPFFSAESTLYDFDSPTPETTANLFVHASHSDNPDAPLRVATCNLRGKALTLTRVMQHLPNAQGLCGGTDWARFALFIDGVEVADFYSGCSSVSVTVDDWALSVCTTVSGDDWRCRREALDTIASPIRVNLAGDVEK